MEYVDVHTKNATKWVNDYSSREAIIHCGCFLAVEIAVLDDEMWPQEQLVQTLVALFRVHTDADLEKLLKLQDHFIRRLKDIHNQRRRGWSCAGTGGLATLAASYRSRMEVSCRWSKF